MPNTNSNPGDANVLNNAATYTTTRLPGESIRLNWGGKVVVLRINSDQNPNPLQSGISLTIIADREVEITNITKQELARLKGNTKAPFRPNRL